MGRGGIRPQSERVFEILLPLRLLRSLVLRTAFWGFRRSLEPLIQAGLKCLLSGSLKVDQNNFTMLFTNNYCL